VLRIRLAAERVTKKGTSQSRSLEVRSKCRENLDVPFLPFNAGSPEVSRTFSHAIRKDGTEALTDRADYRGIRACVRPRSVTALHSKSTLSPARLETQSWVNGTSRTSVERQQRVHPNRRKRRKAVGVSGRTHFRFVPHTGSLRSAQSSFSRTSQ
jgi:hypothetical protein